MMDWLGVAGLWLGTGIMALKAGELDLPAGAPDWLASQWWAIIPLPLVTVSILILGIRAFQRVKSEPEAPIQSSRSRPQGEPDRWWLILLLPILPFAAMILISGTGAIMRRLHAPPLPTPPPVLQGSVTSAFLAQTLNIKDAVAAETLLNRYLGAHMRATGRIYSIRGERGFRLYVVGLTDPAQKPQVYLKFEGQRGLSNYDKQDHIAANCKIERLDDTGIGLNECVLIEAPDLD